jgi:hypothetical protein
MTYTESSDGTRIGYDHLGGDGPPLILISGGLDDGTENLALGTYLAGTCSVFTYRRRGRGDSGDTQPYAVQREIDDLAALLETVGGEAHVFAASSGGALALEAAASGLPFIRIAAHEVPYQVGEDTVAAWRTYRSDVAAALDADDRDEALRIFMRLAGSPEEDIAAAEASPFWPPLRELAPTLRYDAACIGEGPPPAERLAVVAQPVLLTTGSTPDAHLAGLPAGFFAAAADATVQSLPNGRRATIATSGHVPDPDALGSLLADFYAG